MMPTEYKVELISLKCGLVAGFIHHDCSHCPPTSDVPPSVVFKTELGVYLYGKHHLQCQSKSSTSIQNMVAMFCTTI